MPRSRPFFLVCLLIVWFTVSCGDETAPPNRPPSITVTTDPIVNGTVVSSARFSWTANDADGSIARFEYAVDPPAEFTLQEISEGGPGIVVEVIPGVDSSSSMPPAEEYPGVTRVSKTVGGETVSFDWIHTQESSRSFAFSTPDPDTVIQDTTGLAARFSGMHTLYLRAVDDDETASPPYHSAFTATSFAPTSNISYPADDWINTGHEVYIEWSGTDPDGSVERPVSYLYKLIDVVDKGLIFVVPEDAFEDDDPWVPVNGGTHAFFLEPGHAYLFALRAVDEAGAIEPFLEFGRNALRFQAFSFSAPELTIQPLSVGGLSFGLPAYTFVGSPGSSVPTLEIPLDTDISLSWSATAEASGGRIWGYSWGLDIVDLNTEGPGSGWSAWGQVTSNSIPLRFSRPGTHSFHVRVRDGGGGTTFGEIRLKAVDLPRDRELLLVDDSFDGQFPTDSEHDTFWRERLQSYGIAYDEFSAHGDNDRGALSPVAPDLELLGRYKTVIWVNFGSGYNGQSALHKVATLSPTLASYLLGGGQLWVTGRMTVPPMVGSADEEHAQLVYPIDDQVIKPGTFAWDFMKLQTTRVLNPKGSDPDDFCVGVAPYPGPTAPYDSMTVVLSKLRYPFQTAVTHCDGLVEPLVSDQDPAFRGTLEKLYTYRAYGPEVRATTSDLHGRLTALRWHDPDPAPIHGRTQWFGFPLYFMDDNEAQETVNRSLDWFRQNTSGRLQ